jgi:dihydroorotate dehydrogenase
MAWRVAAYRALRPLLFATDPEAVHHATLRALTIADRSATGRRLLAFASGTPSRTDASSAEVMGLRFRTRVGLAAGFDKDALALAGWAALGFGFVEVGTVTPLAQAGQPRPRLFRLRADEALVNRLGFNNAGAAALASRVASARRRLPAGFVVGVNIGRGRDTAPRSAAGDYVSALRAVAEVADYVAINVSSPNTPRLRGLQEPDRLARLLARLAAEEVGLPLVVKLAPDLPPRLLERLLVMLADSPARGVILSNTTTAREGLRSPEHLSAETGGLSGRPLRDGTLATVSRARHLLGDRLAIIASGGISTRRDARQMREAGADLVQIWTGLVYRGPGLVGDLLGGEEAGH